MAQLSDQQKFEIVSMLAGFCRTTAIVRHFRSQHGLQIDRKQVGRYDPQRFYYAAGDKWRDIFDARRKAVLENVAEIPIAHLGYRLQMLQQAFDAARRADNWPLAARLLKQAAREMGRAPPLRASCGSGTRI